MVSNHHVCAGAIAILLIAGVSCLTDESRREPLRQGMRPTSPPPTGRGCRHDDLGGVPLRVGGPSSQGIRTIPSKIIDARPDLSTLVPPWPSGVVIIEIGLTAKGEVRSPCVLRGIGAEQDAVALDAVRKWRFAPALIDGKPVPCVMAVTVTIPPPRGSQPRSAGQTTR
jgi:TonB family protein